MDTLQRNQQAFEGQSKGFSSQGDTYADEEALAEEYNHYERLCDPSHTRCVGFAEFQGLFRRSGLEVISARQRDIEEGVVEWMDFSLTEDKHREEILRALNEELGGGAKTGLAPYTRDSVLYFRQRDAAIVGRKV